jgi:O-antigen ligase
VDKRVSNLIVFAGPATTLAISPWFNFDPINLIKVLILTCISFAAFGLVLPYLPYVISKVGKKNSLLLLLFFAALISPFFFSGANKAQQFWGVFGRNTGILSYLALLAILFVTASVASRVTYSRITWSLVATVGIMSAYCLIQIAKLDPISWSAFFPFGTLGNVNFLSGFMGLGLVTVFIFALSSQFINRTRIALVSLFLIGVFVLIKSDSTQGIVALVVGVASYLLIRSWYLHRALFIVALILFSSGFISLVLGLLDKGPLRGLIYQFTVLYRADYMHAGIAMLLHNPLTGVGIDSYDDWYRAERGIISALRTSLNRTANSAHNISIDLAAGGGFPLLIAYLLILGVISLAILKGLRSGLAKDPVFMALSMSWFAYQVQASVSINQIGVGVWGWILGGALLGYTKIEDLNKADGLISNSGKKSKQEKKSQRGSPNTPPPISVVSSATLLAIGFTLAFLPLKTDADFATAAKSGSAEKLLEITSRPNINTFFLAKAASDSVQSNLPDIGKSITTRLTTNFPRTLIGHLITYDNPASSPSERDAALEAITRIDPFVAFCYSADSAVLFRRALDGLSSVEKYKLARGWGFSGQLPQDEAEEYSFEKVPSDELLIKIRSFCGY